MELRKPINGLIGLTLTGIKTTYVLLISFVSILFLAKYVLINLN